MIEPCEKQRISNNKSAGMEMLVISDDLTGACGVGSMLSHARTVTVNLDNLEKNDFGEATFISLNINARFAEYQIIQGMVAGTLEKYSPPKVALRIDSLLRGSTSLQISVFAELGKLMVTDTIPEFGRYTHKGTTYHMGSQIDINGYLLKSPAREFLESGRIEIVDSKTQEDIEKLAQRCLSEDIIPVDPGPLIAAYSRMLL